MNERPEQNGTIAAAMTGGIEMLTECGASASRPGEGTCRICAWCGRFDLGYDCWVEVDAVPLEMVEQLSHGVCPECFRDFLAKKMQMGASSVPAGAIVQDVSGPGVRPWWLPE